MSLLLLPPSRPVEPALRPRRTTPKRVALLVEDEASVRSLCAFLLERAGYWVFRARCAAEAIEMIGHLAVPVDLLVSDVVLPDANGIELASGLTATSPKMRVLLLSGYPEQIVAAASAYSESADFLAKPFSPAEFTARVRVLCAREMAA